MDHLPISDSLKKQSSPKMKEKWTADEDEKLRIAILRQGPGKWTEIAEFVGTRTNKQCRERYSIRFAPDLTTRAWSQEEDEILREKRQLLGNCWSKIAKFLPGRSRVEVKNRGRSIQTKCNSAYNHAVPPPRVQNQVMPQFNVTSQFNDQFVPQLTATSQKIDKIPQLAAVNSKVDNNVSQLFFASQFTDDLFFQMNSMPGKMRELPQFFSSFPKDILFPEDGDYFCRVLLNDKDFSS